ncbi:DNA binding domain-containing protein, excisionase family [Paenibacillus algorifonticola]|uniref:DNA binding domain-containing protein, excisionase family n=1 Tax=Paenibacillus algorifonticola TaxID=684063 RepID=A0A1I2GZ87_9BACL|nr:helix-turn-helix domain-containing protein [Paenibacillus algorifonticola]SFF22453.1 DNA binding domain-containing protein, excisionase family [Paenibacillus algorifonticola]
MNTVDFIEAFRADVKRELREEILAELEPAITQRLYNNLFTSEEAARYLKISISTLRRITDDGEVTPTRIRTTVNYEQEELDRYRASKRLQRLEKRGKDSTSVIVR